MSYKVLFTDIALKNLKKYPQQDQKRILSKIEELAKDPLHTANVKQLVNFSPSYRCDCCIWWIPLFMRLPRSKPRK